ncbi:uncharacterized protein SPAPADRAFT_56494 [Spathaspora passalidarum NRRL Y-27907]|uniref:Uncharacterized protein n=1 Tax=Spathaspora passalidarum (strain NRRL Y-27907 / 11-Y1) TaxID=619300 RepID=G3AR38_SPAPN|nr:uncharacterized protein SPAPADRAFT_56494 [Spathaspora passalidarum NRRL Y-27907]EGW31699.1 hypothetical protein SPAPADRAFT_56494 [Spathaspora passalidarum NRRL Y-27907]
MNKSIIRRLRSNVTIKRLSVSYRELATAARPTQARPIIPTAFKPSQPWETELLGLPNDHPHNPLIDFSKDEIVNLTQKEYRHLNGLSYGTLEEMSGFCLNIIEIVQEKITEDPRLVSWLIREINDTTLKETITSALAKSFQDDEVKSCIIQFIIDPTSTAFRVKFFQVFMSILELTKGDKAHKGHILLNFLEKLSRTNVINSMPLLLSGQQYHQILEIVPREKRAALFSRMVCVNLQTIATNKMERFKKILYHGTSIEKLISRTGLLFPKWHDLHKTDFGEHNERIIEFYTVKDLSTYCNMFIDSEDPANAILYLKFLLEKYERKYSRGAFLKGDTSLHEDTQSLLLVILNFVTKFKGVSHSAQVLKYLTEEGLTVDYDTYLLLMRNMRLQGYYNEAIVVMNNIDLNGISNSFKKKWAKEIMLLMRAKFPSSPKVIIGYAGALYGDEAHRVLALFNDLKILPIVYSNGSLEPLHSFEEVKLASVDKSLTGNKFTTEVLASIYNVLLSSIPLGTTLPRLINKLFEEYMRVIQTPETTLDANDDVIRVFLKHLLKDTSSTELQVSTEYENFAVAKRIFTYYERVPLPYGEINPVNIDLLIQAALLVHKDYEFATRVMKLYRKKQSNLTFPQIYSFVKYHHEKSEYDLAKHWYDELVRQGAQYVGPLYRSLFDIARKMDWPVTGHAYKWGITKKHRRDRQAMATIHSGSLSFLGKDFPQGDLKSGQSEPNAVNFGSELAATLHEIKKLNKRTCK